MRNLTNSNGYTTAQKQLKEQPAVRHIREVVERRLTQLLLARLYLLGLLVDVAEDYKVSADHLRRLWVLLQVQPAMISRPVVGMTEDIFTQLTQLLRYTSADDFRRQINQQFASLSDKLCTSLFYCVFDEVQVTITPPYAYWGDFVSDTNGANRPILREIWNAWSRVQGMRLVLAGTGINSQALHDRLTSSFLKEQPYDQVHDIGAFDDQTTQTDYIKQYVPARFLSAEFLNRAWAWGRGR